MSNDPFDTEDPFSDPATGSSMDAFLGRLVILKPQSVTQKASKKGNGMVDVVEMGIIVVDGEEPGLESSTSSYSNSLNPQIKGQLGKMVVGRLEKKDFGKGAGWHLVPATAEERQECKKVYKEIKEREAKKAAGEDPFA